jgi:small subunit ribosomal protein S19
VRCEKRYFSYRDERLAAATKKFAATDLFEGHMSRSLYKGPNVDEKLLKKVAGKKPGEGGVIKTWARGSVIAPEMVGFTFGVHNGKTHIEVLVAEEMVGHKFGEFSPTKKFWRHGGKMQKELDQKKKEAEIAAAKAAKATTATKK